MCNKLSEKVLVFLTALLMIVLNSCSMGTTEGENVTDNTRYAIEELICDYFATRYDKVTALNVDERMDLQDTYFSEGNSPAIDKSAVKAYFENNQAESDILYTTVHVDKSIDNIISSYAEVAVAFYPDDYMKAYLAIYKYNVDVISIDESYKIEKLDCTDTTYVDTYGQDIHVSDGRIVAIGDDAFEITSDANEKNQDME